jgi:hypothetical protein
LEANFDGRARGTMHGLVGHVYGLHQPLISLPQQYRPCEIKERTLVPGLSVDRRCFCFFPRFMLVEACFLEHSLPLRSA